MKLNRIVEEWRLKREGKLSKWRGGEAGNKYIKRSELYNSTYLNHRCYSPSIVSKSITSSLTRGLKAIELSRHILHMTHPVAHSLPTFPYFRFPPTRIRRPLRWRLFRLLTRYCTTLTSVLMGILCPWTMMESGSPLLPHSRLM